MNIIHYAFKLGKEIGKTQEALQLKTQWEKLENKYKKKQESDSSPFNIYQMYFQSLDRNKKQLAFFAWAATYETIKENYQNPSNPQTNLLLKDAELILNDEKIVEFNVIANKFASEFIDFTDKLLLSKTTPKLTTINTDNKLNNLITDLFNSVIRSGIKQYITQKGQKFTSGKQAILVSQYTEESASGETNTEKNLQVEIRKKYSEKGLHEEYFLIENRIKIVQHILKSGLFSSFWDNEIVELSQKSGLNIPDYNSRTVELINISGDNIPTTDCWFYDIETLKENFSFIVYQKNFRLDKNEQGGHDFSCTLSGYHYPNSDVGLLIYDDIFGASINLMIN